MTRTRLGAAREPPEQPLVDRVDVARRRRHEEPVVAEAGDGPVVEDDSRVVEHGAIPHTADAQVAEPVRVQPVEEVARVRALQLQLAERADVDDPCCLVNGRAFSGDIAVVKRPLPVAHVGERGPERDVAIVHRGAANARHVRAGERGEGHRLERRSGGRRAGRGGARAGDLGVEAGGHPVAHLALARTHRDRAVALQGLEGVEALLVALVQLLDGHDLTHADELLAAAGGLQRLRGRERGDGRIHRGAVGGELDR